MNLKNRGYPWQLVAPGLRGGKGGPAAAFTAPTTPARVRAAQPSFVPRAGKAAVVSLNGKTLHLQVSLNGGSKTAPHPSQVRGAPLVPALGTGSRPTQYTQAPGAPAEQPPRVVAASPTLINASGAGPFLIKSSELRAGGGARSGGGPRPATRIEMSGGKFEVVPAIRVTPASPSPDDSSESAQNVDSSHQHSRSEQSKSSEISSAPVPPSGPSKNPSSRSGSKSRFPLPEDQGMTAVGITAEQMLRFDDCDSLSQSRPPVIYDHASLFTEVDIFESASPEVVQGVLSTAGPGRAGSWTSGLMGAPVERLPVLAKPVVHGQKNAPSTGGLVVLTGQAAVSSPEPTRLAKSTSLLLPGAGPPEYHDKSPVVLGKNAVVTAPVILNYPERRRALGISPPAGGATLWSFAKPGVAAGAPPETHGEDGRTGRGARGRHGAGLVSSSWSPKALEHGILAAKARAEVRPNPQDHDSPVQHAAPPAPLVSHDAPLAVAAQPTGRGPTFGPTPFASDSFVQRLDDAPSRWDAPVFSSVPRALPDYWTEFSDPKKIDKLQDLLVCKDRAPAKTGAQLPTTTSELDQKRMLLIARLGNLYERTVLNHSPGPSARGRGYSSTLSWMPFLDFVERVFLDILNLPAPAFSGRTFLAFCREFELRELASNSKTTEQLRAWHEEDCDELKNPFFCVEGGAGGPPPQSKESASSRKRSASPSKGRGTSFEEGDFLFFVAWQIHALASKNCDPVIVEHSTCQPAKLPLRRVFVGRSCAENPKKGAAEEHLSWFKRYQHDPDLLRTIGVLVHDVSRIQDAAMVAKLDEDCSPAVLKSFVCRACARLGLPIPTCVPEMVVYHGFRQVCALYKDVFFSDKHDSTGARFPFLARSMLTGFLSDLECRITVEVVQLGADGRGHSAVPVGSTSRISENSKLDLKIQEMENELAEISESVQEASSQSESLPLSSKIVDGGRENPMLSEQHEPNKPFVDTMVDHAEKMRLHDPTPAMSVPASATKAEQRVGSSSTSSSTRDAALIRARANSGVPRPEEESEKVRPPPSPQDLPVPPAIPSLADRIISPSHSSRRWTIGNNSSVGLVSSAASGLHQHDHVVSISPARSRKEVLLDAQRQITDLRYRQSQSPVTIRPLSQIVEEQEGRRAIESRQLTREILVQEDQRAGSLSTLSEHEHQAAGLLRTEEAVPPLAVPLVEDHATRHAERHVDARSGSVVSPAPGGAPPKPLVMVCSSPVNIVGASTGAAGEHDRHDPAVSVLAELQRTKTIREKGRRDVARGFFLPEREFRISGSSWELGGSSSSCQYYRLHLQDRFQHPMFLCRCRTTPHFEQANPRPHRPPS